MKYVKDNGIRSSGGRDDTIHLKRLRHTELIFRGGVFPIKRKYLSFFIYRQFKIQKIMLYYDFYGYEGFKTLFGLEKREMVQW